MVGREEEDPEVGSAGLPVDAGPGREPDVGGDEHAAPPRVSPGSRRRVRSILSGTLVVMVGIATVLAATSLWLHASILDSERFTETVEDLFSDPAITDPMAAYLTDRAFEALEVEQRVEQALASADTFIEEQILALLDLGPRLEERLRQIDRPRFADLAAPLVESTRDSVERAVRGFLRSEEFQERFPALVLRTHEMAVALLRGDYDELPQVVVSTETVALDFTPLVAGTIQRLVESGVGIIGFDPPESFSTPVETPEAARAWLDDTLGWQVAPEFAQVTIMSADRLEQLQWYVRVFDRLVWILAGLAAVLAAFAIVTAPRKPRAVVQISLVVVGAILLTTVVVRRLEEAVVGAFADPEGREAARTVIAEALSSIRTLGIVVAVAALLVGAVSFAVARGWHVGSAGSAVSSPGEGATAAERFVTAHYDGLRIAGGASALVALVFTGLSLGWVTFLAAILTAYLGVLAMLNRREPAEAV